MSNVHCPLLKGFLFVFLVCFDITSNQVPQKINIYVFNICTLHVDIKCENVYFLPYLCKGRISIPCRNGSYIKWILFVFFCRGVYCSIDFESLPMPDLKKLPNFVTAKSSFFAFHFPFMPTNTSIFGTFLFFLSYLLLSPSFLLFFFPFLKASQFFFKYGFFGIRNFIQRWFLFSVVTPLVIFLHYMNEPPPPPTVPTARSRRMCLY